MVDLGKKRQKFGLCIQASAIKSLDIAKTTTKPSLWHLAHCSAMGTAENAPTVVYRLGLVHGTCPLKSVMGHHESAFDVTEDSNALLVPMVAEAKHKVTSGGFMLESPCVRLGHCRLHVVGALFKSFLNHNWTIMLEGVRKPSKLSPSKALREVLDKRP